MEPSTPSDAAPDPAYDLALALAEAAGAGDLSGAVADGDAGAVLLDTLLTHELAIGHSLMARLAASADGFIRRIGEAPDGEPDRAIAEAARLTGVVARMMERYRLGFQTLAKVGSMPNGAKQEKIVRLMWGDDPVPDCDRDKGSSGGGNGGGNGGNDGGGGLPSPSAGPAPNPASPRRPQGFGPDLPPLPYGQPRPGCLRNGNPSGDLAATPRCGAATRAGGSCRQPAMANGRCRLHGGKSTGPKTAPGLAAARAARLSHGAYVAALIALRSDAARSRLRIDGLVAALRRWVLAGHGVDPANRPASPGTGAPGAAPVGPDGSGAADTAGTRPADRGDEDRGLPNQPVYPGGRAVPNGSATGDRRDELLSWQPGTTGFPNEDGAFPGCALFPSAAAQALRKGGARRPPIARERLYSAAYGPHCGASPQDL